MLFNCGDQCKDIYILTSGVIDIVITDGTDKNKQVLDVLGKGSVLGMSNVLQCNRWAFRAVNNTRMTAIVTKINHDSLYQLTHYHKDLHNAMHHCKINTKIYGLAQIDYVIESVKL